MMKKVKLLLWIMFPVTLGISVVSFASLSLENIGHSKMEARNNIATVIESRAEEKPKYFYLNNADDMPRVGAKAYLVGDLNTGEVILSKNQTEKFPIASVSKLMTALVTKEITGEDDTTQITKQALDAEGKNGGLWNGEKIKTLDLLYPLLLESSNDAAEALAIHFDRDNFISKMNQEAERLKMTDTKYEDPSGLSPNNQSTVADMFKLVGYLTQQQEDLIKITALRSYSTKKHSWSNINQFIRNEDYMGGKSGYTDRAKQTVVSLFSLPLGESGVRPIAITLLQSNDRKKDVETILQYLKKNIYYGGTADASTNWVQEKIGMPNIKDPNYITFTFAGDMMLDRGVRNSVVRNFNNNYAMLFEKSEKLSEIFQNSDIVFANLEGTASDRGVDQKNLYSFRMDPSVIPALKGAGISIVSVANNHVGDWGRNAYIDTLSRLKENEILYTGGGNTKQEAETPVIIEKYGTKIGFLGFSDVGPAWMKADTEKSGILLASDPRFDEIVQNASEQVDYLVVSFHFGDEYKEKHNRRQEELAHKAIDAGAKIVIGHHPHVIEDTEVYKDGFIAYSLGNFIFDQSWSKPTMQGMLLELKLNKNGAITIKKDTIKLNSVFQPETLISGKEEKLKF